tara:strand:- start:452 stop:643 length:192 start_codon:yes stop_codon:yes gene_type:complete
MVRENHYRSLREEDLSREIVRYNLLTNDVIKMLNLEAFWEGSWSWCTEQFELMCEALYEKCKN